MSEGDFKIVELKKSTTFNKVLFIIQTIFQCILFRPDIVFCSHINFSPLCLFLGIKYIVFTHGIDVWNIKEERKKKALLKAGKVVTVSRFTKQKLIEQTPELKNKIFLLPNTVDGDKFYPKKKSQRLIDKYDLTGKKVVLTISRLSISEGYKGYDKIIQALPAIIKEVPNVVYILAGSGDDVDRIKNLIKDLGLENNVILQGFIPDEELVDYYNLADVFVMPSKGEGFGIVFIEALACGVPVIAGNIDGSRDAILDGKLGTLVNPNSTEEITKTIISVLQNKTPNNLLNSETLRREVLKVFGIDVFEKKVLLLLNELQDTQLI